MCNTSSEYVQRIYSTLLAIKNKTFWASFVYNFVAVFSSYFVFYGLRPLPTQDSHSRLMSWCPRCMKKAAKVAFYIVTKARIWGFM
jgi:hypothetical protein